ncbi:hypothetical protein [Clostridioides difficile]|uniref:hypothetical protein n=1 Tax=Clostridioides difficile TaxID=1496 RepID=UPI001034EEFD|nr:hypothetical protein [Clostridioides difficile]MDM9944055.1 hypothetical protein [Clostridioides difficile]
MENIKNDLGYTKNMKKMIAVKVFKVLNEFTEYNGSLMKKMNFITLLVLKGYLPECKENFSYYSKKINGYTKPKNIYILSNSDSYYNISKTEFNYAKWLITNNITDIESVKKFEEIEINRIRKIKEKEKLKFEAIEKEKLKLRDEKRKEKELLKNWLEGEVQILMNKKDTRIMLLKDIFSNEINMFSRYHLNIIVLVDNIDNVKCKIALKELLHYHNKASKKAFYHLTGIRLPCTNKETESLLDKISSNDFKGIIPYKLKPKIKI